MSERNISNYQGCFQLVFKNIELDTQVINIMFNQLNFMSMKTISLLSLDLLQKQELSIMEGGQTAAKQFVDVFVLVLLQITKIWRP